MPQDHPQRKLDAALALHWPSGLELAPESVALLAAVATHGSITAAAEAVGISYRTAWNRIEALNNRVPEPLVARVTGGRGGGGSQLTPAGERMLALFHTLEDEHRQFLDRLAARIDNAEQLLPQVGALRMETSARNQFHGQVTRIEHGAVNAEVSLDIGGGNEIVAIITEPSLQRLHLREGADAVVIIKASSVILTPDTDIVTSARNRLCGTVAHIERGAVNSDVVLDIGGGKHIGAIITNTSAERLALEEGMPLRALVKASHVILAVPA